MQGIDLPEKIKQFPHAPGVYLMTDARGVIIYVGKAKDLRSRVRSYFQKDDKERYQLKLLLSKLHDIEIVITDTEKEALLLERTLIARHKPKYNILFRDDKTYVSIKINMQHKFPGIFRTRRVLQDGSLYFGPYTSGLACRETIESITRYFRLRTCSDRDFANRSRPCIQHQIGRCTAPCVGLVTLEDYAAQVEQARMLLRGERSELTVRLREKMRAAAAGEQFEEAGRLRDLLGDIAVTVEPQKMVRHADIDRDYIGLVEEGARVAVAVLEVREGKVVEGRGAVVAVAGAASTTEIVESFMLQYYRDPRRPPELICVPVSVDELGGLEECLSELRGSRVTLRQPKRGAEAKLLKLACVNAQAMCRSTANAEDEWDKLSAHLQKKLHLPHAPNVIECVDISNWQGAEAVGSLVVFERGESNNDRYRRFCIRGPHQPNDYQMMYEVITRRFIGKQSPPLPDLFMVDGGKGHLSVALRVLEEQGIENLPVAAIAKAREDETSDKIYLPGRKNPVNLKPKDLGLLFLQRIRDEAHRFAISHQRQRQRKRMSPKLPKIQ